MAGFERRVATNYRRTLQIKESTHRETKTGMLIQDRGIRITPRGISFLFENSLMEKVKRTLKDIKEIIPFA